MTIRGEQSYMSVIRVYLTYSSITHKKIGMQTSWFASRFLCGVNYLYGFVPMVVPLISA